jgi:hypothetical protein
VNVDVPDERVMAKSSSWVIANQLPEAYNMNRNLQNNRFWIFLGCALIIALLLAALQPALVLPKELPVTGVEQVSSENGMIEPGGSQGETLLHQVLNSATVFGLIASLTGAAVLAISLMILSRRRA